MIHAAIAAAVVAIDEWRKEEALRGRPPEGTPVLGNLLTARNLRNEEAAFHLGCGHKRLIRSLSVGLTVFIGVLFGTACAVGEKGAQKTGLALLFGGAVSNTYDRLRREYVIDYFSFRTGVPAIDRIAFNLADFAILTGALITVFSAPAGE